MASDANILAQMLSTSSEMKPLPLSMRSKTKSELRVLSSIIGRRRRTHTSKRGLMLWESISKEFNAIPWVSKRTPLQLRKFWGNHKCRDPVVTVESKKGKNKTSEKAYADGAELITLDGDEGGLSGNVTEFDSEVDSQDIKLVPEIEIHTEPESFLEVSGNGQLNFYQNGESLDLNSLSPPFDESVGGLGQEEHHLRLALLRQQQLYRQVEHAAKVEEHEAAMKVLDLQKEYWKRMINKL